MAQVFPDPFSFAELVRLFAGPAITGALAFGGVVAGGWVSRRTTLAVLEAQTARDREKAQEELRVKRGEILRAKAEELLSVMHVLYDRSRTVNEYVIEAMNAWSAGEAPAAFPAALKAYEVERTGTLASFYFPEAFAAVRAATNKFHENEMEILDSLTGLDEKVKDRSTRKTISQQYAARLRSNGQAMDRVVAKLREALQATMP